MAGASCVADKSTHTAADEPLHGAAAAVGERSGYSQKMLKLDRFGEDFFGSLAE